MEKKFNYHNPDHKVTHNNFQYFTANDPTKTTFSASTIDQHRNSIEQRIANLEAKLSQKYQPDPSPAYKPYSQSQNYINNKNTATITQNSIELKSFQGSNSKSFIQSLDPKLNVEQKNSQKNKLISNNDKLNKYSYLSNIESRTEDVLKQKRKHVLLESSSRVQNIQMPNHLLIEQGYQIQKRRNSAIQLQNQNIYKPEKLAADPIKINESSYKKQQNIKERVAFSNVQTIQDNLSKLNKNIANLRAYPKFNYPIQTVQTINYSLELQANKPQTHTQNSELYQMMQTILQGQQRLQKELFLLKNKENQHKQTKNIPQKQIFDANPQKQIKQKTSPYNPKKSSRTPRRKTNPKPSASPKPHSITKSPLIKKNTLQQSVSNRKDASHVKNRSKSTLNLKKSGKITKNKDRFYELYKQAEKNKRLSEMNNRIKVSKEKVSSVWQKIRSVVQRSQIEDREKAKVYHENNRYVNEHLVNTIELQKKLKNDLVKKIYEMCQNKCLYK